MAQRHIPNVTEKNVNDTASNQSDDDVPAEISAITFFSCSFAISHASTMPYQTTECLGVDSKDLLTVVRARAGPTFSPTRGPTLHTKLLAEEECRLLALRDQPCEHRHTTTTVVMR